MSFTQYFGDPPPMAAFFICITLLLALNLSIEPNISALAMEPMGESAGIASAVYGTCFFFIGSYLGSLLNPLMDYGVLPMVIAFVIIAVILVMLVFRGTAPATKQSTSS